MAKKATIKYSIPKPDFTLVKRSEPDFENRYQKAFYFVHYEIPSKTLRKETVKLLKRNTTKDVKILEVLPDSAFSSLGKYAYILTHGGELLNDAEAASFEKGIDQLFEYAITVTRRKELEALENQEEAQEKEPPKNVYTIQDHLRMAAEKICSEIEAQIDLIITDPKSFDPEKYDVQKYFISAGVKSAHCPHIIRFYQPMVTELTEVINGDDPDLAEGYSNLTKTQVKKLLKFVEKVVAAAEHLKSSKVTARRPRKKKPVDIHKLTQKLKFLPESDELKMKSIRPYTIVGAKELWVYNVKTKKVGRYIAFDDLGLTVKGTSIQNFSSDSAEKRIKDVKIVSEIKRAAKRTKAKIFKEDISTMEIKLKGRTNENLLLIEVIK